VPAIPPAQKLNSNDDAGFACMLSAADARLLHPFTELPPR
jgi:hypothetical protein